MEARGRAHRFGDDVNTDYIISAKAKESKVKIAEMVPFLMEDIRPGFAATLKPGDLLVAGKNFGCGSSREAAPAVIKAAGVGGVLAGSFARIFYRNAANVGLPLLEFDTAEIPDGADLHVDFASGVVTDRATGRTWTAKPLPRFMLDICQEGGLVPYLKQTGGFVL
jgi:3-isopropylmalate/(R)-2-methylmalate dehydratase small subunit